MRVNTMRDAVAVDVDEGEISVVYKPPVGRSSRADGKRREEYQSQCPHRSSPNG